MHATIELLRRCAEARDPEIWEQFVRRFEVRLTRGVRRALRRTGQRMEDEELEDLLQEVYCRLLENDGRPLVSCRARGERGVAAYLGRVAESVAIDRLRAAAAVKRGRGRLARRPAHLRRDPTERAIDPARSPEDRLLDRERRLDFLRRCRRAAGPRDPRRDVQVLYLAFVEGLTSREIARLLGRMTPSSIDSLVHRAKRRLADEGIVLPRRRDRRLTGSSG